MAIIRTGLAKKNYDEMIARSQEWKRRASLPSPNPAYIPVDEYKFDKSWFNEGFGHVQTKFSPTGEFVVFCREDGNTLRIKYQTHNGKRKCWDEKPVLEDPGQYFRGWQDMTEKEFEWVQAYIERTEKVAEEMDLERMQAILKRRAENTGTTTPVESSHQTQGRIDTRPIQLRPRRRTYSIKQDPNNPPPPGVDITAVYYDSDTDSSSTSSSDAVYEVDSDSSSEFEPDSPVKKRKRARSEESPAPEPKRTRFKASSRTGDHPKPSTSSSSSSTHLFVQSAAENLRPRNRNPLHQKTNNITEGPNRRGRIARGRGKPKGG